MKGVMNAEGQGVQPFRGRDWALLWCDGGFRASPHRRAAPPIPPTVHKFLIVDAAMGTIDTQIKRQGTLDLETMVATGIHTLALVFEKHDGTTALPLTERQTDSRGSCGSLIDCRSTGQFN